MNDIKTSDSQLNIETIIKLNKFLPRNYQLPLCDALENKGYKKLFVIWPRRCLSGNTHILMSDGSFKFLKDIRIGDKVLSSNGFSLEEDVVKNVWSTGIKNTKKIRSSCYLPIIASEDHVFAHMSPSDLKVSRWNAIKDIKNNRALLNYAGWNSGCVHDIELAQFWGFILADGYVSHYQQPKFTNKNKDILDRVSYLAQKLFGVKVIFRPKGLAFDLGFSNGTLGGGSTPNPIKELFRSEGCDIPKSQRRLPKSLWSFDRESVLNFFSALISADGNIYCHATGFTDPIRGRNIPPAVEITFSCGSSELYAMDIYWLLRKIGIVPQVPYLEKGSNWKIKVAKGVAVKTLLSCGPVYGKEDAQQSALKIVNSRTFETKSINGFFRAKFNTVDNEPEELFDIETERNHNFIANGYLVHNSGKDIVCWNLVIRQALRKIGVYYYIFPSYSQARKVIWDSITNTGSKFIDFIPKELVASANSQEMKIKLTNGSLIQLIGSDNIDSIVGTNPSGAVFSEYALQDPRAYQFIRPIFTANGGWAIFESTPRGKNHAYELFQIASNSPEWFCQKLTVEDTHHIPLSEIEKDRQEGIMSEDLIQQEYYTSFTMGVEGSYYAKYIDRMRLKGQIGVVPYEPGFKVNTVWDLGVRDSTSIIFFQIVGQTVRIIDYYEKNKEGLEHYIKVLNAKEYVYGKHFGPHDIGVTEFGSGTTRIEKARELGLKFETTTTKENKKVSVIPNVSIMDGIEAVRSAFGKIWIDEGNCGQLIKALENYRQEYDVKKKIYNTQPLHNWASHAADCLRYMVLSLPKMRDGNSTPEELDRRYRETMYGQKLPGIFGQEGNGY